MGQEIDVLFNTFKEKAEAFTVKVIRCATAEEAEKAIHRELKEGGFKKVVSVPLEKINLETVKQKAQADGIEFITDLNRDVIEQAEFGISEFDLGISTLGTIAQDATDVYKRLVSTLPLTHLAIINTKSLVGTFEDALAVIQETYGNEIPGFMAFVTGPSKTADIERVLTIGVHGPERLIVVCVD
jgi:L-lactate dehydrogenase complex protein LldG